MRYVVDRNIVKRYVTVRFRIRLFSRLVPTLGVESVGWMWLVSA